MNTKVHNKKSKRVKKRYETSLCEKVAKITGCSSRMVRYVLDEKRCQETELAQKILIAAAIIEERENKLLEEIKRVVGLP